MAAMGTESFLCRRLSPWMTEETANNICIKSKFQIEAA
jgi:hypothetical protein